MLGLANSIKEIVDLDSNKKYVISDGEYKWEE